MLLQCPIRIDEQASYSPSAPIQARSFITFIISPTCDITSDIYNGFIKATLHVNARQNPLFTNFQLRCGGYRSFPSIPFRTFNDPMFIKLCQNVMNVNGQQTGFNKEVVDLHRPLECSK